MIQLPNLARLALATLLMFAMAACTWVRPADGAEDVQVISEQAAADCERLGSVEVSVAARVIGMDRHDDEVASDLRNLARNHAAERGGDTAAPLSEIQDGKQRFAIYSCEGAETRTDDSDDDDDDDSVSVQPYEG